MGKGVDGREGRSGWSISGSTVGVDITNSTMMKALTRLQHQCFAVRTYHNFYGGEFVPSKATHFYDVRNPVTQ